MLERGAERLALEELGDQIRNPALAADVVHRKDVRVAEGRGGARLGLESTETVRVRRELAGEHLDGDIAPETRIAAAVHFTHSARAEQADDLVWADPRSPVVWHSKTALVQTI